MRCGGGRGAGAVEFVVRVNAGFAGDATLGFDVPGTMIAYPPGTVSSFTTHVAAASTAIAGTTPAAPDRVALPATGGGAGSGGGVSTTAVAVAMLLLSFVALVGFAWLRRNSA